MNTPTKHQLNPVSDDLDGRKVVEHLLGKTVEEALSLLEANSAHFQEDYTWMGAEAFCYYSPALILYLRSPAAHDDHVFAYGILGTFKQRLDQDGLAVEPAFPVLQEFCASIEEDTARLGFDENSAARARRRIAEVRTKMEALKPR